MAAHSIGFIRLPDDGMLSDKMVASAQPDNMNQQKPGRLRNGFKRRSAGSLPGFGLTMGFTLMYMSFVAIIPLGALILYTFRMSFNDFVDLALKDARVLASYRLSFTASFSAALINAVFGFIVAWVLVRYNFPGRRFVDAVVDLPFALPTAVSGIALTTLYAPTGWIGALFDRIGIRIAYAYPGIVIALTLIGLPFMVRTLQPAIEEIDRESEEAAASLGATRRQVFFRVILPSLMPSLLTGFALAFARALGEFGSIYFIAGNLPYRTEIAPLLILIKLEQFDYPGAAGIGVVMLLVSFLMLLIINLLQYWSRRKA